jgi:hypothetical protein
MVKISKRAGKQKMRYREFLLEAKPDNLGDGLIKKIGQAYFRKVRVMPNAESTDPVAVDQAVLQTGYSLADSMYNHVGPKNLIWVAKQFVQDPHFMPEDFPAWADTLGEYTSAVDARKPIERDLNKFANINQLRTEIRKYQDEAVGEVYDIIVPVLDKFVQQGQAAWLYKGKDYAIYRPDTWQASNEFYRVLNNKGINTSLCVTYSEDMYKQYTKRGVFVLIIAPDTAYISYISTGDTNGHYAATSEFSDMYNDHQHGLEEQIKMFPRLKPILADYAKESNDVEVLIYLNPALAKKKYPEMMNLVEKYNIRLISPESDVAVEHGDPEYLDVDQAENFVKVMNDPKNSKEVNRLKNLKEYGLRALGISKTEKSIFGTPLILCQIPGSSFGFGDRDNFELFPAEFLWSDIHEDYLINILAF